MFEFRCPQRWSDLDAQGHVNNAHIVDYMQEARVAFFRSGPTSSLLDSGIVVVGHQAELVRRGRPRVQRLLQVPDPRALTWGFSLEGLLDHGGDRGTVLGLLGAHDGAAQRAHLG